MDCKCRRFLIAFMLAPAISAGQTGSKLEFEVASVKPSGERTRPDVGSGKLRLGARISGDRAEYIYMSLRQLIAEAYQVRSFQVLGPEWLQTERFDVFARIPAGARKEDAPGMLQALLAERFRLVAHRESREQDVAALVVDKGGSKLAETPADGGTAPHANAAPPKGRGQSAALMMGETAMRISIDEANSLVHWEASGMTMPDLAQLLMRAGMGNGRPVVDQTGLKGKYEVALDIPLSMISSLGQETDERRARAAQPAELASDPSGERAVRSLSSLGLALKKGKAPVEHVVVDRMDMTPREN